MIGENFRMNNVLFKAYQNERSIILVSGLLLELLKLWLIFLSANCDSFFHSFLTSSIDLKIELTSQYKQFMVTAISPVLVWHKKEFSFSVDSNKTK